MNTIAGLLLLIIGIAGLVLAIQILFEDSEKWQENHGITMGLRNGGKVDNTDTNTCMLQDKRTSELIFTQKLSAERINS
jgi:hypothetical protein